MFAFESKKSVWEFQNNFCGSLPCLSRVVLFPVSFRKSRLKKKRTHDHIFIYIFTYSLHPFNIIKRQGTNNYSNPATKISLSDQSCQVLDPKLISKQWIYNWHLDIDKITFQIGVFSTYIYCDTNLNCNLVNLKIPLYNKSMIQKSIWDLKIDKITFLKRSCEPSDLSPFWPDRPHNFEAVELTCRHLLLLDMFWLMYSYMIHGNTPLLKNNSSSITKKCQQISGFGLTFF